MNKKKILFIMPSMFIGGAERSLLGLLNTFDYDKYEVSLFLYRHEGEFFKYIPEQVKLLPKIKEYGTFDVPIKSLLKSSLWEYGIARLIGKMQLKSKQVITHSRYGVWASMQYISKKLQKFLPDIPGKYDTAISFLGIPDVLLNKTYAKNKIAWNHTDYSILGPDKEYDKKFYDRINYIVSVSEPCTRQFLKTYPEYVNKAVTIQNILSVDLLRKQAKEQIDDMVRTDNEIMLLSVGRFSYAKNFDNVPEICKLLVDQGMSVKWYLIGYGGDELLIRKKIQDAGMQEYVIILGKKENPYPHIKSCDIYVQPSRYEGKCVSVLEAQILNRPVIITNYATASSQLEDGVDGVIVPMDIEGCAKGIIEVIRDKELQQQLIENTKKKDYTNAGEIEKLYRLMEG
jgi:glycosyltransferase involved in cell wall biosynthesis